MPYSGGSYSLPVTSWNPAVASTTISATDWNTTATDLSTALSTCLLKDGTQTATALIPFAQSIRVGVAGSLLGYVDYAGNTSGTTRLQPAATASGTLTLPAATDTLVGKATTDNLTNKTITSAVAAGTWTASGTWTLPAFTLGGTVTATGQTISGGAFTGGTWNNGVIGGTTAAAITGTTITANTSFRGTDVGTGGTVSLNLTTSGGTQARVNNVASTNRSLELYGSNGGNPELTTSAGNLALSAGLSATKVIVTGAPALLIGNTSAFVGAAAALNVNSAAGANARLDMGVNTTHVFQTLVNPTTVEAIVGTVTTYPLVLYANNAESMRFDTSGNKVMGTGALGTTATNGFPYIPGCAGTPTGVPTSYSGRVPLVVDTTNNKLYFYSGGAWRDAGP